jgi:hypothetical protein
VIARVTLPSGKTVIDTGRVLIGILAENRPPEQGEHARIWQRVLTAEIPRQWEETPRVIKTKPSLWERIRELANVVRASRKTGRV